MALLRDAIFAHLDDETSAASRIFPVTIPQSNTTFPVLVYQVIADGLIRSNRGGGVTSNSRVQITAIDTTYNGADDLMDAVRVFLDGTKQAVVGSVTFQHILQVSGSMRDVPYIDATNEQKTRFGKTAEFLFFHNINTPNQ